MGVNLSVLGIKELDDKLRLLPTQMQEALVQRALVVAGDKLLADVKARAPVKSGQMRDTMKLQAFQKKGVVGVRVVTGSRKELGIDPKDKGYYPAHVELGTKKDPADPFMRATLESNRSRLTAVIGEELFRSVSKGGA